MKDSVFQQNQPIGDRAPNGQANLRRQIERNSRDASGIPLLVTSNTRTPAIRIIGTGSHVPSTKVLNNDLSNRVKTSDAWIRQRTGITERRIAANSSALPAMATAAGTLALRASGVSLDSVSVLIVATSTPSSLFGDAALVAERLGLSPRTCFDVTAACSGFLVALTTASELLRQPDNLMNGRCCALVIGADALSQHVDWTDRSSCVLFGDGAGAVVIEASDDPANSLFYRFHSRAAPNVLQIPMVASDVDPWSGSYGRLRMDGKAVYEFACAEVPAVVLEVLELANVSIDEVDHFVLHQANARIIDEVSCKLRVPLEKFASNVAKYGNTSAASIPLVLDEYVRANRIKSGEMVVFVGFGAGLLWGAAVLRWDNISQIDAVPRSLLLSSSSDGLVVSSSRVGSVCLITGGTSGIGAATARMLESRGCVCVVVGRNKPKDGEFTGTERIEYVQADVTKESKIREAFAFTAKKYGGIDYVFNNAG